MIGFMILFTSVKHFSPEVLDFRKLSQLPPEASTTTTEYLDDTKLAGFVVVKAALAVVGAKKLAAAAAARRPPQVQGFYRAFLDLMMIDSDGG